MSSWRFSVYSRIFPISFSSCFSLTLTHMRVILRLDLLVTVLGHQLFHEESHYFHHRNHFSHTKPSNLDISPSLFYSPFFSSPYFHDSAEHHHTYNHLQNGGAAQFSLSYSGYITTLSTFIYLYKHSSSEPFTCSCMQILTIFK